MSFDGSDPTLGMGRLDRLSVYRAWHDESVYARSDALTLYPLGDGDNLRLRVPTARIITRRHLGLEIKAPPEFRVQNEQVQSWVNRILKLNGVRGSMRGAATLKSWAGDVGALFAWKPSERAELGTPWQVGFIPPESYHVAERWPSGVFKAVDVYTFEDRPHPSRKDVLERWWTRTRYTKRLIYVWPEVLGSLENAVHPHESEFDALIGPEGLAVNAQENTLGVIPFTVIQNTTTGTQEWWGESDYHNLTHLFHRLNVHLDAVEQGEQIRNRLMLALIDAEDISTEVAEGITALLIRSKEDGTDDKQAQLHGTPLMQTGGTQLAFFQALLDLTMEAAGVAQTGSAREVFGNEAASSSAMQTYYAMQTAVVQHKRENWLGERPDFGLSALHRKLLHAASRVDRDSPVYGLDDLTGEEFDLYLEWPPMFALSAAEKQTEASVAQQANDDGLPPEHIAPTWAKVLGRTGIKAVKDIQEAIEKRQAQQDAGALLRPSGAAARGILGSGQGDGLAPDGGSVTSTVTP